MYESAENQHKFGILDGDDIDQLNVGQVLRSGDGGRGVL